MDNKKKLELLAEILEVEPEELKPEMELAMVGDWDSLAILSFISMMDEEFGREVSGEVVKKLVTVQDVLSLMGDER